MSPSLPPVYFLGIGGPNFIENHSHAAYTKLQTTGLEITSQIKQNSPEIKAIVVLSAHWQDSPSRVSINVAEEMPLIYDFNNFPAHYYEVEFPNRGSGEVAQRVVEVLRGNGVGVEMVERGLDHGVWTGFLVAFDPKTNPLNIPIVQVSLFGSENLEQHYNLGKALGSLREEGILIIGAGMAVHNLQDFRASRGSGKIMPYTYTFDEALKEAVTSNPEERKRNMMKLAERDDFRKAHPSLEHLLPVYVAAGAAGGDVGEQLWTLPEGSLSWAQYRFGKVSGV